ncbi:hypothetical protein [Moraxella lacunata]
MYYAKIAPIRKYAKIAKFCQHLLTNAYSAFLSKSVNSSLSLTNTSARV